MATKTGKTGKKAAKPAIDLSSRALIVDMDTGWWNAEIGDKEISDEVADLHKISKKAGRYTKKLYPFETEELDACKRKIREADKYHKAHTLPWNYGQRILKASFFMEYSGNMKKFAEDLIQLNRDLVAIAPEYQKRAKVELNGTYREANYPSIEQIGNKFSITVTYLPLVAPGDFRVELDEALLKELREQHAEEFAESQTDMTTSLWKRIYGVLKEAAALEDKETRIYAAVFNKLDELADVLPSLNMTDDPDLTKMAEAIKKELSGRSVDVVRKDESQRLDVAKKAQSLADKMAKFIN